MTSYNYTLGIDFTATSIDIPAFEATIQGSSITSATVQYIIQTGTLITIYFSGALSSPDITTLNGLVAAYVYVAPTAGQEVDTSSVQTISNKLLDTTIYRVDASNNTKKVGWSLSGMSASTTLTLATSIATSRTYTIPDTGATSSFIMSDSTGTQTISTGNLTIAGSAAILSLSGSTAKLLLSNTSTSTSATTGALQSSGGAHFKNLHIAGSSHVFSGVPGSLTGILTTIDTSTVTVNSTADMAFVSIQQPTLANSVAASTTTNAYTMYIANAPAAGTNETITNAYALGIGAGKVLIGGTLQIPTGASSGYVLTSDASGNVSWSAPSSLSSISLTGQGNTTPSLATFYSAPASTTCTGSTVNYFNYFAKPITTGAGNSTGYTVYIQDAPSTPNTAYSLYVAAGLTGFAGDVTLTGNGGSSASTATLYIKPSSITLSGSSNYYFTYLDQPVTTGSTTGSAYTLYIANAPANATTSYALYVEAGNSYFGENLQFVLGAGLNYILKSDASGNASWTSTVCSNYTAKSTTAFNTTATTPTNITTMTLTPTIAGTYLVLFSTQCTCATNTTTLTLNLALNGSVITTTSTTVITRIANEVFTPFLSTIATFNGSTDTITARLGSSSGTITVTANTRFITAIRLST